MEQGIDTESRTMALGSPLIRAVALKGNVCGSKEILNCFLSINLIAQISEQYLVTPFSLRGQLPISSSNS